MKPSEGKKAPRDDKGLDWVRTHLQDLSDRKFYGNLNVRMEGGRVTVLKMEQTLKPPG